MPLFESRVVIPMETFATIVSCSCSDVLLEKTGLTDLQKP